MTRALTFLLICILCVVSPLAQENVFRSQSRGAPAPPPSSSVAFEFTAANADSVYADGEQANPWTDLSGNARHATCSGACPTLNMNENPIPAVQFSNDVATLASGVNLNSSTGFFAGMSYYLVTDNTILGAASGGLEWKIVGNKQQLYKAGTGVIATSTTDVGGDVFVAAYSYDGTTAKFWLNGVADGTTTASITITGNTTQLGQSLAGSQEFYGRFGVLKVYNGVRTTAEINSENTALCTAYSGAC